MLINLRNAMMAGGGWKNPYVTDGLVAMWDGEWNVAGGVHDGNSRNFTNLATGEKISLDDASNPANVVVGSNYIEVTSPCVLSVPSLEKTLNDPIPKTFEVVWTNIVQNTTNNWNRVGWFDCGFVLSMTSTRQVAVFTRRGSNSYSSLYGGFGTSVNVIDTASAVTLGVGESRRTYRNATEITLSKLNYANNITSIQYRLFSFDSLAGSKSRIFCMRGYDRALTAAEVAANYAVDKARFNLPDAT